MAGSSETKAHSAKGDLVWEEAMHPFHRGCIYFWFKVHHLRLMSLTRDNTLHSAIELHVLENVIFAFQILMPSCLQA